MKLRAIPSWVPDAVFYHIFVDRFRRAGENWTRGSENISSGMSHGGNLAGIIESIPYIRSLGVNAIYLTPVFHAASYHKYDTLDYFTIDPVFGTNDDLDELVERLHRNGINLVLDGVFNHCSNRHPFFQSAVQGGPGSRYWRWFRMTENADPFGPQTGYGCWAGVSKMPEWNHNNPDTSAYLLSVVRYWIVEHAIDGWRLDTTEYLPPDFVRQIYRTAKDANPDAYVLGEVMGLGTPWFRHQAVDGVMHYKLLEHCVRLFAHGSHDVETFGSELYKLWNSYPEDANFASFTLLSSHDTPRFLTECAGDENLLLLALAFQFTFPGTPSIYYGDEIGLQGRGDPDNRRPFPWSEDSWNHRILRQVRQLSQLRAESIPLRRGSIELYRTEGRFLSYFRIASASRVLVALNLDPDRSAVLPLPERCWISWDSDEAVQGELRIPPLEYRILRSESYG